MSEKCKSFEDFFDSCCCVKCKNEHKEYKLPLRPAQTYRDFHLDKRNPFLNPDVERRLGLFPELFHTSVTSFGQLQPTTIDQLMNNAVAKGKYVILRVVEEIVCLTGWHTVVEDSMGNACFYSFYNFPKMHQLLLGDVIVVKEPCFLSVVVNKRHYMYIREDSLSGNFILTPAHPLYFLCQNIRWHLDLGNEAMSLVLLSVANNYEAWFERGRTLYNMFSLAHAKDAFSMALRYCRPKSIEWRQAKLMLAKCMSVLGFKKGALKLLVEIIDVFKADYAINYLIAEYNYSLRNYTICVPFLSDVLNQDPNNDECLEMYIAITQREEEQTSGKYDMEKLKNMKADEISDCADYIGPVDVSEIFGKGRGLVLSKRVPAKKLLLATKALAIKMYQDSKSQFDYSIDSDLNSLASSLADLVVSDPKVTGKLIYELHNKLHAKNDIPLFCNQEKEQEPICHMNILSNICQMNVIPVEKVDDEGNKKIIGGAIYHYPSYINHSCCPNVSMEFYNDMVFIYSIRSMKMGDELVISYVPEDMPPKERKEMLEVRGVSCYCDRCKS